MPNFCAWWRISFLCGVLSGNGSGEDRLACRKYHQARGCGKIELAIDEADNGLPASLIILYFRWCRASAFCHVCRTVCRRAERRILALTDHLTIDQNLLAYINRLSDYLFVLSRRINFLEKKDEIFWNNRCK